MNDPVRFGPFELRTAERKLLRAGQPMPIGSRAFDVLVALVERRHRLASKAELLEAAWPGLVVEEANLQVQIANLRRLVGKDAIATVPGLGYRWAFGAPRKAGTSGVPSASTPEPAPAGEPRGSSVAVLAFDVFSGDPRDAFVGQGFADDLITELARDASIRVPARHSSFGVQGLGLDACELATRLGVGYIVEGSVRRIGSELIVNAQLIDGGAGTHLWAERATIGAGDIVALQDRLLRRIVGTTISGVRRAEFAAGLRTAPISLNAYALTQRGAACERLQTAQGMRDGREALLEAVRMDPGYAPGLVWLGYLIAADAFAALSGQYSMDDMPVAIAHIRRGIELDPRLALGHQALGFALSTVDALDEALAAAERSVQLGPGDADNLNFLSRAQLLVGQYGPALDSVERALGLNPLPPPMYLVQRARVLYALDQYAHALEAAKAALHAQPSSRLASLTAVAAAVALGDHASARERVLVLRAAAPTLRLSSPMLAPYFARDPPRRQLWQARLRNAGMPE
jgi:adenylate cyclase